MEMAMVVYLVDFYLFLIHEVYNRVGRQLGRWESMQNE